MALTVIEILDRTQCYRKT